MQEAIILYFSGLPNELVTFLLSMMPVTELRGAIPLAIVKFQMDPFWAFFYAVLGNSFMGFLVVLIMEPIARIAFVKIDFLHKFWLKYIDRITNKNRASFEKWGSLALIIFIAIPLPMTGAFTGGVLASIFDINIKKALLNILAGCTISGAIVTMLTLGFKGIF